MKMNITILATSAVLILSSLACGNKKNVDLDSVNYYKMGDTVTLSKDQSIRYYQKGDWDIEVKFDSLIGKDSRCPEGANCIWEGNAAVALTLNADKKTESIVLNTNKTKENTLEFAGYKVELVDVKPFPVLPNIKTEEKKPTTALIKITQ